MTYREVYIPLLSACWLITICHSGIAPPPPPPPIPIQPSTDYVSQQDNTEPVNNSSKLDSETVLTNKSEITKQATSDTVLDSSIGDSNDTLTMSSDQKTQNDSSASLSGVIKTPVEIPVLISNDSLAANETVRDKETPTGPSISKIPKSLGNDTTLTDALDSRESMPNITNNLTLSQSEPIPSESNKTQIISAKVITSQTDSNTSDSALITDTISDSNQTMQGAGYVPSLLQNETMPEITLPDSGLGMNKTLSANKTSSLIDKVQQPPITFSEQNGSTTVEITSPQFDNISLSDLRLMPRNVSAQQKPENISASAVLTSDEPLIDGNITESQASSNVTTYSEASLDGSPRTYENITGSQLDKDPSSTKTMVTVKPATTTISPIPSVPRPIKSIEDKVAVDHPPPIFLDGRRPPVYTDASSIPSQQYLPDLQKVPQIRQAQTTEPPAPPPIFVPRRPTRPIYRFITTTTPTAPYRPAFTQVQTLRPENDPRYMTVAELAELALRNRNMNKPRKANLVFFNTIQPLTPEPIVTTTPTPFNKRPEVVYQPGQSQTLPKPSPIAESPKQFYDANFLLNQIANRKNESPTPKSDNKNIHRMQPQNSEQNQGPQLGQHPTQGSMLPPKPVQERQSVIPKTQQQFSQEQPSLQPSNIVGQTLELEVEPAIKDKGDQFGQQQPQSNIQPLKHIQQSVRNDVNQIKQQLSSNIQKPMINIDSSQSRFQTQEQNKVIPQNNLVSPDKQIISRPQANIGQAQGPQTQMINQIRQQPQNQQQKIQQLIDDLEKQQEELRRILQQHTSNQGKPPNQSPQSNQQVQSSEKPFFNSEYLQKDIGIVPSNKIGGSNEARTSSVKIIPKSNSFQKPVNQIRKNINPSLIPTQSLFPQRNQNRVPVEPKTQPIRESNRPRQTTRRPSHRESYFTPFVKMDDLFSSQALEAWIKTMAVKPEVLQQVQNENRNRVNDNVKFNIQKQSFPSALTKKVATNPPSFKQSSLNEHRRSSAESSGPRPTFQKRPTITTRSFQPFTQRPTMPQLSVRNSFNRRSRNFQPNTVIRPSHSFSLPRPRQYVYGDGSTSNVGNAPVANTLNNQISSIGGNEPRPNIPNLGNSQLPNGQNRGNSQPQNSQNRGNSQPQNRHNRGNSQMHNSQNRGNSQFLNSRSQVNSQMHDGLPRGHARQRNSPRHNNIMTRIERSSPQTIPQIQRPNLNPNPSVNQLQPKDENNNMIQQFPLAQRLGFTNVMSEHNTGFNNMDFNQINFQPNIITNTGARSRMIPARTLEDMKSHWSSKAGNSIKLPVDQVPYFLRTATEPSANNRQAPIQSNPNSDLNTPSIPYRLTTTSSMPVLIRRYTTTTALPTVPPTVDPNPPAIFDTKMLRTFMPMPKQDFTTRPSVNKMNFRRKNSTGNRTSIPGFDDRCSNCTFVNQRCLLPDPVHCNMFIECVIQGSAVRGFNRECALGSFFDRKSYLCVDPKNADCPQDRCRESGLKWYPIHGHCKHYWSCASREGGGIYAQSECCPDMGGFVEEVGCVENRNCTESCDSAIVTASTSGCHLRKTASPKIYFDTNANIERPCAPGTLFNEQKCTCEQDIAIERSENRPGATSCLPMLNITFDSNIIGDSSLNKQHIGEEGVSTTPNGEGIFNGVGRLILWRYANLMFPVVFAVRFRFETATSGPRFQTVISNCDPKGGRAPTFDITLDTRFHEVIFKVDTLESPTRIFKETYQHTKDTTVVLIYDGERIVGSVDNRARNIIATGGIETRPNPISIGACGSKEGFNGLLDDLTIFEDCIPDDMYGIFMSVLE